MPDTWDFLPEFTEALKAQLESDAERWGDTWLERTREGQESRFDRWMSNVLEENQFGYIKSMPWLKIAGEALIGWIRENHPELFPK